MSTSPAVFAVEVVVVVAAVVVVEVVVVVVVAVEGVVAVVGSNPHSSRLTPLGNKRFKQQAFNYVANATLLYIFLESGLPWSVRERTLFVCTVVEVTRPGDNFLMMYKGLLYFPFSVIPNRLISVGPGFAPGRHSLTNIGAILPTSNLIQKSGSSKKVWHLLISVYAYI